MSIELVDTRQSQALIVGMLGIRLQDRGVDLRCLVAPSTGTGGQKHRRPGEEADATVCCTGNDRKLTTATVLVVLRDPVELGILGDISSEAGVLPALIRRSRSSRTSAYSSSSRVRASTSSLAASLACRYLPWASELTSSSLASHSLTSGAVSLMLRARPWHQVTELTVVGNH